MVTQTRKLFSNDLLYTHRRRGRRPGGARRIFNHSGLLGSGGLLLLLAGRGVQLAGRRGRRRRHCGDAEDLRRYSRGRLHAVALLAWQRCLGVWCGCRQAQADKTSEQLNERQRERIRFGRFFFVPEFEFCLVLYTKKCPSTVLQQYITHLGQNIVKSSTSDKMTTGGSDMVRDPRES